MNVSYQGALRLHFAMYCAIALCFFFQALTWGSVYRFFAYLVLLLCVGIYFLAPQQNQREHNQHERHAVLKCLLPLVGFTVLEWIATFHFPWDVKALRHVLLATGLMAGIVLLAREHVRIKAYLIPTLIFAVYAYTLFQVVWIYGLGQIYGTTKNPHYLAIYSALFLVVAVFLATNWSNGPNRYGLIVAAAILGFLLLNTSSRPTWIALMMATLIGIVCLRNRAKVILIALAGVIFAVLFFTDAGSFKTRMDDLVINANTEERVTIWEDTWAMQQQSSRQQWLFGHGVEGFENDFEPYSRYYSTQGITYNSPHNAILEVLYLFGLAGLTVVLGFILWLYYALFSRYFRSRHQSAQTVQMIALMLLALLTVCMMAVSITLPFFISININIIALVMGVMFYLDRHEKT
jgi:O-antigen ligase